jgi:hypothetical protein
MLELFDILDHPVSLKLSGKTIQEYLTSLLTPDINIQSVNHISGDIHPIVHPWGDIGDALDQHNALNYVNITMNNFKSFQCTFTG